MAKQTDVPYDLSDRVYLITGGTGSLGSEVVVELAMRGARLILLCADLWEDGTLEFVANTRRRFQNKQIYALTCDLRSIISVDTFLSNWHRPKKPRRLDGIICCATTTDNFHKPKDGSPSKNTFVVNYYLQRYLINGLRSTLLSQPSHRDVRIILITSSVCQEWPKTADEFFSTQLIQHGLCFNDFLLKALTKAVRVYCSLCVTLWKCFYQSQLIFGLHGRLLQRQLNEELRSDGSPSNIVVSIVDPGLIRNRTLWECCFDKHRYSKSPSKLKQLVFNMMTRSCHFGARSIIYALFSPKLKADDGGSYIRNCQRVKRLPKAYLQQDIQEAYEKACFGHASRFPKRSKPFDVFHIPNFEH